MAAAALDVRASVYIMFMYSVDRHVLTSSLLRITVFYCRGHQLLHEDAQCFCTRAAGCNHPVNRFRHQALFIVLSKCLVLHIHC